VYRFDGTSWVEEQKLIASDGASSDEFGFSVALAGDVALVGARLHDDNGADSGSAYVYRFDGTSWVEEQKLIASDGASLDEFGESVALADDTALVGARLHDDNGADSGSAYVYRFNGTNWVEEQELIASDGTAFEHFGRSVALAGNLPLVGASSDDNGQFSGSAYAYLLGPHGSCGNGAVDPGEACDDGGLLPGDGCSASCQVEECSNGVDDDGDGLVDFVGADPGCWGAADLSERSGTLPCDNGFDDDGDGRADFDPATLADPLFQAGVGDPGCHAPDWPEEDPQCSDGVDNGDADDPALADWDGAGLGEPDPECNGRAWKRSESGGSACGLGPGLALALLALGVLRRRRPGLRTQGWR